MMTGATPAPDVVAIIWDVNRPERNNSEYRVFVNCEYLSQDVPTSDPHFVATFGFFGDHDPAAHGGARSFIVKLTPALRRLERQKRLAESDKITVQILPVPAPGVALSDAAPVTPARVEVGII